MESASRIGCMANRYARIAMLHYADAKMQAETIYHTADYDEMSILEDKLEEHCIIVVVFSAMALESYFNDYLADKMGDKFYYENFDMIRPTAKMQFIAKFIFHVKLDKGQHLYHSVDKLFKLRNQYVHNKSKDATKYGMTEEQLEKRKDVEPDFEAWSIHLKNNIKKEMEKAEEAVRALCKTVKWIDQMDKNSYAMFWVLGAGGYAHYNEEERRKICQVQKEFGIPVIKEVSEKNAF